MKEFCIFWKLFVCSETQGKSNLFVGSPWSPLSPLKRQHMVLTWLFHSCILFPPNFMLDYTVLAAKKEIQVATDCNNFEEFAVQ